MGYCRWLSYWAVASPICFKLLKARRAAAVLNGRHYRRQQQADQDANDGNDHQQLDDVNP